MKKFLKLSLVLIMFFMVSFFLIGCKKETQEEKELSRVTVDINPSIELIVDEENKVVSVTALNDDGNVIIVGEAIVGKTVEEAISVIVSVATETGYLVKGEVEATENDIEISVSGDEKAQKELYDKIKGQVEKVVSEENINAIVSKKEALEQEALKALALELDPTLTEDQVNAMTEQELLEALKQARLERANLYSEVLVDAYNQTKEYEIKLIEHEEIAKILEEQSSLASKGYAALVTALQTATDAINRFYYDTISAPSSDYQKKYKALLDAKAELVVQREKVEALEEGIEKEAAKQILKIKEEAYTQAIQAFDALSETLETVYEQLIARLEQAEASLESFWNTLTTEIQKFVETELVKFESTLNQAKDEFFEKFEQEHASEIEYYQNLMLEQKAKLKGENE